MNDRKSPPASDSQIPIPPGRAERGRQRLPNRRAVLAYWGFAHASLLAALAALALSPRSLVGFPYHPKLVAVVHLVTLGWITCSIFGALHMLAPMALRSPVAPRRVDIIGFVLVATGIVGMVAHFWIGQIPGLAWSGLLVSIGFAVPVARFWSALRRASIPPEVKLHFDFAFVNLALTAAAGLALAVNKLDPWLPVMHLDAVWGHAHLAGLGWATMMVMASGYRLLPMFLPAAMPTGRWVWCTATLVEIGVLGLAVTLTMDSRLSILFAGIATAGIACFGGRVRWMLANRRPGPRLLERPDLAMVQVRIALAYLAATVVLGAILLAIRVESRAALSLAYGAVFLIGFVAQMILGVAGRLLPLATWLWIYADRGYQRPPTSPLVAVPRALQATTLTAWAPGVPCLAVGLATGSMITIRASAALLMVGLIAAASGQWLVGRRLRGVDP